jgi:hypothetical protein
LRSSIGFVAHLSASHHPAFDQQHRANMLQVPARIASNAAGAFQLQGQLLDVVKIAAEPGVELLGLHALVGVLGSR